MDKIIEQRGEWVLYDNGDVSCRPETRDYWIDAARLKTTDDLWDWVNHLRRKTWWHDILETDLERITIESFRLKAILTEDISKTIWSGAYLKN